MKTKYRNTAFLVEVVVNILVFSICCSILVSAFAQASLMVRQTKEESQAATEVYALLETVKVRGPEGLENAQEQPDGSLLLEYDKNWLPVQGGEGAFVVRMEIEEENTAGGVLCHINAWAHTSAGRELCHYVTAVYLQAPTEGGAAA